MLPRVKFYLDLMNINNENFMEKYKIKKTDYIEFKKKKLARNSVNRALNKNELVKPKTCHICLREGKINAHHIDYGKPLDVIWLCNQCHGLAHRENSDLNPKNNSQTPTAEIWNDSDMVTISFNIPIKQFIIIKKECMEKNKKMSSVMREDIIKKYPVESSQLEFNFDEVNGVNTSDEQNENISGMDKSKTKLLQQEIPSISFLRTNGSDNVRRMETQFYKIPFGYGENADFMQCIGIVRK